MPSVPLNVGGVRSSKLFPLRSTLALAAPLGSLKFVSPSYTDNFKMDVETSLSETRLT